MSGPADPPSPAADGVVAPHARDTVRFEREGTVGRLVLDRPDKLNAFTIAMWRELAELGAALRADPELRVLVVVGAGRAFSSGIDTTVFTDGTGASIADDVPDAAGVHPDPTVAAILHTQDAYTWLAEAPFPTIAAVRGYALGAGLQLALACDLRVVARGTQLGLLEHRYGILPDLGGTQRLPRLVGAGKAKELIWTAARIDADEAHRLGICERLVDDGDLDAEVADLATLIARQPPLAVQGAKRAVDVAGTAATVRDGLLVEAQEQARCLTSADMREAVTAVVEGRPPLFEGR